MKTEKEALKISRSFIRYIRQMSKMKDEIDLRYKLRNSYKNGCLGEN